MTNSIKDTIISTISKTMPFIPGYINYFNEGICIDTSNRRIGFDTFDPSYTIDLSMSDATINFKDSIQLKGTDSFLVNPINSITATTSKNYNMLTSTQSTDFSSIQAAPIIYNPQSNLGSSNPALYPSNNDIDLGTPDLCWNNIYCKKMYGSTVILDIVCSSIDCSGNIDCSTLDCSGIICDGNIDCSTLDCSGIICDGIICDGNITTNSVTVVEEISCNSLKAKDYIIAGEAFMGTKKLDNGTYAIFANNSINTTVIGASSYALLHDLDANTVLNAAHNISFKINNDNKRMMDITNTEVNIYNSGVAKFTVNATGVIINDPVIINGNTSIDPGGLFTANAGLVVGGTGLVVGGTGLEVNGTSTFNGNVSIVDSKTLSVDGEIHAERLFINGSSVIDNGWNIEGWTIMANNGIKTNTISPLNTDTSINIMSQLRLSGLRWAQNNSLRDAAVNKNLFGFILGGAGIKALGTGSNNQSTVSDVLAATFPNWGKFLDGQEKSDPNWRYDNDPDQSKSFTVASKFTFLVINTLNNDPIKDEVFKFAAHSDKKLKTNIEPFNRMLDLVKQFNPVYFTWIDTSFSDYGFIAQELEKIIPEIITHNKDDDGEITRVYSMEAPMHFISVLTKAIQDLAEDKDTEIAELKAENTIFKSKIATLENKVTTLEEENNTIKAQISNILERLSSIEN